MPSAYCTECRARVTVRSDSCLLGHDVDPATVSPGRGRHAAGPPARARGRTTRSVASPAPLLPTTVVTARPPVPAREAQPIPSAAVADRPAPAPAPRRTGTSTLAPTGELVEALWRDGPESTAIDGWVPEESALTALAKLRRAPSIAGALAALMLVLAVWWIAGAGSRREQALLASVGTEGSALAEVLDGFQTVIDDVGDGLIDDSSAASAGLARLDLAARDLFEAASGLPGTDPALAEARRNSIDVAQGALALETALGNVLAYEGALRPFLVAPELPAQVDTDGIPAVASELAWWTTQFASRSTALPDDPLVAGHRAEVDALVADLDDFQSAYLDALREGRSSDAAARVAGLTARLEALDDHLREALTAAGGWATAGGADLRTGALSLSG